MKKHFLYVFSLLLFALTLILLIEFPNSNRAGLISGAMFIAALGTNIAGYTKRDKI